MKDTCLIRQYNTRVRIIETFVVLLRKLASTCQYGTLLDKLIMKRIVSGLFDESIRQRLLENLTLTTCVDIVKSCGVTTQQVKSMPKYKDASVHSVAHKIKRMSKKNTKYGQKQIIHCKICEQYVFAKIILCVLHMRKCKEKKIILL